jgi:amino acid transporter
MVLVLALTAITAAAAVMTFRSRTLWAFARDDATPSHSWIGHVQSRLEIPVNAVLVVVLDLLLGLLYLINPRRPAPSYVCLLQESIFTT